MVFVNQTSFCASVVLTETGCTPGAQRADGKNDAEIMAR